MCTSYMVCCWKFITSVGVHVHYSLHTSFGMAAQTQKPREFVSRNEKLDDNDDDGDGAVIIVMVFAKTAGIRECWTGGRLDCLSSN